MLPDPLFAPCEGRQWRGNVRQRVEEVYGSMGPQFISWLGLGSRADGKSNRREVCPEKLTLVEETMNNRKAENHAIDPSRPVD